MNLKAKDVMSGTPVFLNAKDLMRKAASVLLDRNISGAPVRGADGKPCGVLTKTDIARYERERVGASPIQDAPDDLRTMDALERLSQMEGFHLEEDEDLVERWMTPKILTAKEDFPVGLLAKMMAEKGIHRVFLTGEKGEKIVGVVTTFDLLRLFGGDPTRQGA